MGRILKHWWRGIIDQNRVDGAADFRRLRRCSWSVLSARHCGRQVSGGDDFGVYWRFPAASNQQGNNMATYECKVCGMSVNATCGKCDAPLENGMLKIDENTEVQISECPNGHGKIKSPLCCGQDMTCSL
jgi:hypothetical protein